MDAGAFTVMQIGYDADGNELFKASGEGMLSLAYEKSQSMIAGCIGLNIIVSLLSTIALFAVVCRRLETFSCIFLLLFALAGVATSVLQIVQVLIFYQVSPG